jgi:uncharacterized tellurite resistance protein B-like protein
MFENPDQEKEYQYTLLNLLTSLSMADDEVSEEEKMFVLKVAKQIGVTADEFMKMQYDPKIHQLHIPTSEQGRMTILYYLLFLMKIDGKIMPAEANLIRKLSFKLGFHHDLTEEMISLITEHSEKKIPADKLLASIKKHLN